MKRILALTLAVVMMLGMVSCFGGEAKPKTFTKSGMSVTLTDDFRETSIEGYTVVYDSAQIGVFALKESFTLLAGLENWTLEKYGAAVASANASKGAGQPKTQNGVYCLEYDFENTTEGVTYHYVAAMYKADDAFWTISFACRKADAEKLTAKLYEYAASVTFD